MSEENPRQPIRSCLSILVILAVLAGLGGGIMHLVEWSQR